MAELSGPESTKKQIDVRSLAQTYDPVKLLGIVSADDYEEITREWIKGTLEKSYVRVERLGGTGDKGRDVVCTSADGTWDNYQCKHYASKLSPSQVWVELGKLVYHIYSGAYTCPKKYFFVAPCGVSTKLRDLLKNPVDLKEQLINNWEKSCATKITDAQTIELSGKFSVFVEKFDFSIFDYLDPHDFMEQFRETPYFTKRFGALEKPRPLKENYPEEIQTMEFQYIQKILDAYSDYLKTHLASAKALDMHPDLKKHLDRQRRYFYSAEYLKAHSREIYDPDLQYFEQLETEIYSGVIEEIEEDAQHGFERLKKVLKRAEQIAVTNNPLSSYLKIEDRKGVCHHLANKREDVKWKR